jgi:hypothetical protein
MYTRRDRYVVSEETLAFCQTALAISLDTGNLSEIAWARFVLGFNQLWCGELDEAGKQIHVALALAERTGDVVHRSRCLTYLTVLYRRLGKLEDARQHASRSMAAAMAGQMLEYTGTARANLAWVAWREGNLAQADDHGRAALESWKQLPPGHSSCSFQWTALWPLAAVACASDRLAEACRFLSPLLEPNQQRLPEPLELAVREAITAWEDKVPEDARTRLQQACELAQEHNYL